MTAVEHPHDRYRSGPRIGVFGGTFDPPHIGHLIVAQEVHSRLALHTVIWVPAAVPPHKLDRRVTPAELRLEMVRSAIGGDDRFEASDIEIRRNGPSYTVDTLRELRVRRPPSRLFLIMGADQFNEFESWHEPEGIASLASVVVFRRGEEEVSGAPVPDPEERGAVTAIEGTIPGLSVSAVDIPRIDVSSTEVRRRSSVGEPFRYLVPDAVHTILERERPYAAALDHRVE